MNFNNFIWARGEKLTLSLAATMAKERVLHQLGSATTGFGHATSVSDYAC